MARERIDNTITDESLRNVIKCINDKESFILEAGAGSGKTWSLIESLKYILQKHSLGLKQNNQQIVCITYTNIAKDEISERIDNNPLILVRTIHEFLWSVIKNYQKELRTVLLEQNTISKNPVPNLEKNIGQITIDYTQYGRNFETGRITHEDVIEFSSKIFSNYPKISRIVANKYPYIFIDEYQDTEERTVDLLCDVLLEKNPNIVLGFFGDSMQKIYGHGIGYIERPKLKLITKKENYRCSLKVIRLLNKIRSNIKQVAGGNNLPGEISFFHCNNDIGNDKANYQKLLKDLEHKRGWKMDESKILFLTHRGIANKLDYENLLLVYQKIPFGRERLFDKDERYSDFLLNKLEKLTYHYHHKEYAEFIRLLGKEGFKINKHGQKKDIQQLMDKLDELRNNSDIKNIIDFTVNKKLLLKPERIKDFEQQISKDELDEKEVRHKDFHDSLMHVPYQEVINLNSFIEESTPFSTKHGVKGAEFTNVLVVIDDSWNQYKDNDVFSNNQKNKNRYDRTLNLLYVCCSRAKDKLALLSLSKLDASALTTINEWFGKENVFDITTI